MAKHITRKRGIGLKEIAIIKMCNRSTVYRNKHKFDQIPDTKPPRYEFNDKIILWYPEYEKAPSAKNN